MTIDGNRFKNTYPQYREPRQFVQGSNTTISTTGSIIYVTASFYPLDSDDYLVWLLNEPSGSTNFVNTGSYTGTDAHLTGAQNTVSTINPTWLSDYSGSRAGRYGPFGKALLFKGGTYKGYLISQTQSANFATCSATPNTSEFTLSFWIFPKSSNGNGSSTNWDGHILQKGVSGSYRGSAVFPSGNFAALKIEWNSFNIEDGELRISVRTVASGVRNFTLPLYEKLSLWRWNHFAVTYNSTDLMVYIDGSRVFTASFNGGPVEWGQGFWSIGRDPYNTQQVPTENSPGFLMSDVRVANIARPASYFLSVYEWGTRVSF